MVALSAAVQDDVTVQAFKPLGAGRANAVSQFTGGLVARWAECWAGFHLLIAGRQIVAGFKGRTGKGRRFALPAESALATAHNQPNAALCVRLAGEF